VISATANLQYLLYGKLKLHLFDLFCISCTGTMNPQ